MILLSIIEFSYYDLVSIVIICDQYIIVNLFVIGILLLDYL